MLFNSYIFLLAFLPLCLLGYFMLNRLGQKRLSLVFLLGMSLWFYGYNMPKYLLLILCSVVVNFAFYRLSRRMEEGKWRKAAMVLAVGLNLAVLFYFKYYDFFAETVNGIFAADWVLKNIMLPLGISFFTFQQISFVVDAFRGEVPDYDFISYACFVTFFPQLIAGPIVTHDELVPQLMSDDNKRFDWENMSRGMYIFAMGLAKKVLLADNLGRAVAMGYGIIGAGNWAMMDSGSCMIVMLSYTLQMYFDFSGYSDMAIGIGKMFNINIPQNFNSPYKALTIVDHWKRWHLTLTRFLTKYVYFPLGGSRKGEGRTYLNIMAVYLISGLWHGAGWTYILWGGLHGAFNVLTRWGKKVFDRLPGCVNWLITFAFLNLGFIIFRAESLEQAFEIITRIFEFDFAGLNTAIASCFQLAEVQLVLSALPGIGMLVHWPPFMMILFLLTAMLIVLIPRNAYEKMQDMKPGVGTMLFTVLLMVWCIFSFGSVSTFLYFNF